MGHPSYWGASGSSTYLNGFLFKLNLEAVLDFVDDAVAEGGYFGEGVTGAIGYEP